MVIYIQGDIPREYEATGVVMPWEYQTTQAIKISSSSTFT